MESRRGRGRGFRKARGCMQWWDQINHSSTRRGNVPAQRTRRKGGWTAPQKEAKSYNKSKWWTRGKHGGIAERKQYTLWGCSIKRKKEEWCSLPYSIFFFVCVWMRVCAVLFKTSYGPVLFRTSSGSVQFRISNCPVLIKTSNGQCCLGQVTGQCCSGPVTACLSVLWSCHLSIHRFVWPSIWPSIRLSVCLVSIIYYLQSLVTVAV